LLEAAAMGRPIITTSNGTVPEYLVDEQSALVVERNLDQLKAAVFRLRDDPGLRQRLGQQAREAILQGGWDWQVKAEEYRTFFESALSKTGNAIITAPIVQPSNYHHYASVLEIQFDLERELRIGYAYRASDLNYINKHLQEQMTTCEQEREKQKQELIAIKESRTYKLVNRLKDSTVGRWFSRIYRWFVG
ncbi:MAG: glycosyltransferase, partial [Chloroflexi bacterium]|nr:glycosyltransferase [Chloroflexota bacterium]